MTCLGRRCEPLQILIAVMAALAVTAAMAGGASARVVTQTLDDLGDSPWEEGHAIGVDARGGAVVAWMRSTPPTDAIFVSIRRPGHRFGAPTKLMNGADLPNGLALAVGARGDAAIVWHDAGPNPVIPNPHSVLHVNRRPPGGGFGAPTVLPQTRGVESSVAAIDGRGRLVVVWRQRSGRADCGRIVMAISAPRGGRFGAPHRISGDCPNADDVHVAVGRGGIGAVAWRAKAGDGHVVEVSTFVDGHFGAARVASPGHIQGGLALAAGGGHALLAWRDRPVKGSDNGVVLAASIDDGEIQRPTAASTSAAVRGNVSAAMNEDGVAIVSWLQGPPRGEDFIGPARAAVRPSAHAAFGLPKTVGVSVEYPTPLLALDASGDAFALSAGVLLRLSSRAWVALPGQPPADEDVGVGIGTSDLGEVVTATLRATPQETSLLRVSMAQRGAQS